MKAQESDRTERRGIGLATMRLEAAGFAMREQTSSDYGIDAIAELINDQNNATGQLLAVQIKAGASYLKEQSKGCFVFRPDDRHVDYWLAHTLPVVVFLCDVDAEVVYWQRVGTDTVQSTGAGYKLLFPATQTLDAGARQHLVEAVTPRVPSSEYTIVSTDDVSHAMAKRYSLRIVINRPMTKPELATVVRDVTAASAKRRYSRNSMVEGKWGDTDAHVVWTFIYASAADEKRSNHTCRSLWIDSTLNPNHAPTPMTGEDVGDRIVVDWKESALAILPAGDDLVFGKEHYLNLVDPLIQSVDKCVATIEAEMNRWRTGEIDGKIFADLTTDVRDEIQRAHTMYSQSPEPPYECHDLDTPIGTFLAAAHNVVLLHDTRGASQWNPTARQNLTKSAISDASKARTRIAYEREKIS